LPHTFFGAGCVGHSKYTVTNDETI
jgi:hypothetical protein